MAKKTGKRDVEALAARQSRITACVAIAAPSAGSQALQRIFDGIPAQTNAAFIVVAHADAAAAAQTMVAAASAGGRLAARMAVDGEILEPNVAFIAEDGMQVTVDGDRLLVRPATPNDGRIDSLLICVAEKYEERAVIVVLADLDAEGTAGVAATKRCGGFAIAEAGETSTDIDPEAATAASIADMQLPAIRIAAEIASYIENLVRTEDGAGVGESSKDELGQQIARIALILRNATGNDFHGYKHATFLRRIQRRMQVVQIGELDGYIERLRADPVEVQHLFQDLLIGVTQFFRDPAEFQVLEREVIPRIFEGRGADDRVRVWVLGCATGEEAYSIAILIREHLSRVDMAPHVQIFATDIDARALAVARSGRYPDSISRSMPPERLARWFVKEGATYNVVKELREMCIFSPHNLIKDAPFSRIDLLSCRNLLIYLNGDLQDRVIPIFHFSLRAGGYLFLGPAENVTRYQKLFSPIDRRNRIFRRLETSTRVLPDFPLSPRADRPEVANEGALRPHPARQLPGRTGRRVEQIAEHYAPAYIVVDENYDVLHFSGRTGKFLEPASGAASLNLLNLVHRDLRLDLRTALHKCLSQNARSEVRNVRMGGSGPARAVNLSVEPIGDGDGSGTLVVFFQDVGQASDVLSHETTVSVDEHVQRLETDLRITKERLQTTIEELESTNEELKSSNEEYQSINEELQSANEELETSKEELQAVNEELQTVNGELAHRVADLARTNSDLKNLLESTQIATIFLDNDLRLRSFTPAASDVFHLIEADVGRPIAHIATRVKYPELLEDSRKVLKSLGQVEREVAGSEEARQFLVRVLPYRSVDNFIAGVVVTFLEITGTVRAEAALRTSERRFGEAQNLAGVGVWEWNPETNESWWSPVVYHLWGLNAGETPPPLGERRIHPDDREKYEKALQAARKTGELKVEWRVQLLDGTVRWLADTGRTSPGSAPRLLGITQDVTERKQTENRLTLLLSEVQHRVRNILGLVRSIVSRTLRTGGSVEELAQNIDGRLQTLARTQDVFINRGANSIHLEQVVRDEVGAVAGREAQVTISGPAVRLRRDAAETMALALHELATNAAKYGALSDPHGRLSVIWTVLNTSSGPRLSLDWQEAGVKLDGKPRRNGFGTELIERGLPYELKATTALDYAREGLRGRIEIPLTPDIAELDGSGAGAG
jgi:two-component system CheB/CheR fusion protein